MLLPALDAQAPTGISPLAILLLLAAAAAGGLYWYVQWKREQAFAQFARSNGMDWRNGNDTSILDLPFHFLQQGSGRGVDDVIAGRWKGLPVDSAHYWYYDESTSMERGQMRRHRNYHHFTVVVAACSLQLPYLGIHQQSLFSRAAELIGVNGLQFESEEFNRHFKVDGQDPALAYKVIDAHMMEWLLGPGRSFNFALNDRYLLMSTHRITDPKGLVPFFDAAKAFIDNIPRLVWQEYGTQPPLVNKPTGT
jgi:hypothetical protein